MQTLLIFPRPVIERAVNPVTGLPAKIKFLNLAAMRELLDEWMDEHMRDQRRAEFETRRRLPAPPEDPEMDKRIEKGLKELAEHLRSGFSPSTAQ